MSIYLIDIDESNSALLAYETFCVDN